MTTLRHARRAALAVAALALIACAEKPQEPEPPVGTAGPLTVALTTPASDDGAIVLSITGGAIDDAVATTTGHAFYFRRPDATSIRAVVVGDLSGGALVEIDVPDGSNPADYSAAILEVADRASALRADLTGYGLTISPP